MNAPPPDTDPPLDQLSPAEEERVRRLLAESRVDEPMPDEVAERIDAALADLAREQEELLAGVPPAERPAGPVVALSSRRRRVVGGLVAAAVVVFVGIGLGELINANDRAPDAATSGSADRSVTSTDDDALSAEGADEGAAEDEAPSSRAVEPAPGAARPAEIQKVDAPIPEVRPEQLGEDALRVRRTLVPGGGQHAELYQRTTVISPVGFKCTGTAWGPGVLVGVQYDDRLAMLAYREPTGDQQVAEVLQCGTGDLLRSSTIPAP